MTLEEARRVIKRYEEDQWRQVHAHLARPEPFESPRHTIATFKQLRAEIAWQRVQMDQALEGIS